MSNETTQNDELRETIAGIIEDYGYQCINTERGYHESPDEEPIATEIIALVTAARDAEIRELLLSDKAKNASAHEMQELSAQGVIRNHALAFYGMKAALAAIGLGDSDTGGQE